MTRLPHAHIDPEGLQEFSVVFTDRSLNHMSARFQQVMRDVSSLLKEVYRGSAVALVAFFTWIIAPVLFFVLDKIFGLRPSEDAEREGLDLSSHGERAYNY